MIRCHLQSHTRILLEGWWAQKIKAFLKPDLKEVHENEDNGWQDLHRATNTNANTTTGGDEVELLQSGQTGAMVFLSMNKGDTIDLSVNANYETAPVDNNFLSTVYSTLFGSYNTAYAGGEAGSGIENEFNDALNGTQMGEKSDASTAPRAYLNYIFFDEGMNFIRAGFDQISAAGQGIGNIDTLRIADIIADREGYVLAYLSNENQDSLGVHFDDFTVVHSKTNVVQSDDYYPFGLTASSYRRTAASQNNYLYNAGTELNDVTGLYETPFRRYDPSIGRFTGVDALAGSQSAINPYHYGYNNPVSYNDPTGLKPPIRIPDEFRRSAGGGRAGYAMNSYQGSLWSNHWSRGIGNSDWSAFGGSDIYRAHAAAGAVDIGGTQYYLGSDGSGIEAGEMWGEAAVPVTFTNWKETEYGEVLGGSVSSYTKFVSLSEAAGLGLINFQQGDKDCPSCRFANDSDFLKKDPYHQMAVQEVMQDELMEVRREFVVKMGLDSSVPWNQADYRFGNSIKYNTIAAFKWWGTRWQNAFWQGKYDESDAPFGYYRYMNEIMSGMSNDEYLRKIYNQQMSAEDEIYERYKKIGYDFK